MTNSMGGRWGVILACSQYRQKHKKTSICEKNKLLRCWPTKNDSRWRSEVKKKAWKYRNFEESTEFQCIIALWQRGARMWICAWLAAAGRWRHLRPLASIAHTSGARNWRQINFPKGWVRPIGILEPKPSTLTKTRGVGAWRPKKVHPPINVWKYDKKNAPTYQGRTISSSMHW